VTAAAQAIRVESYAALRGRGVERVLDPHRSFLRSATFEATRPLYSTLPPSMASFANQIAASSEKVGGWVSSQGLRPVLFGKDTISDGALVLRILAIHFPASWRAAISNPLYSTSAISSFAPAGLACAFS
jgi:hypothetical protein